MYVKGKGKGVSGHVLKAYRGSIGEAVLILTLGAKVEVSGLDALAAGTKVSQLLKTQKSLAKVWVRKRTLGDRNRQGDGRTTGGRYCKMLKSCVSVGVVMWKECNSNECQNKLQ